MGTSTFAPGETLDALPANIAFKVAAHAIEAPGSARIEGDKGIVTALVSVTGIEDSVRDIIVPGAYAETLKKRNPKVCWNHSWEQPIGRVTDIVELLPGDSRLPKQTKDGRPWPRAAGALMATMQVNLKSERGREAWEAIKFFSESHEAEWSIGYTVSKSTRDKAGVRHIKSLDLYEASFVLFGAAPLSMTTSVKAAAAHARAVAEVGGYAPELDLKYNDAPMGKPGNRENWVDKAGGLPPFVRALARGIMRSGKTQSQAIAIAIGQIKRWAAGGGDVTEKTRAKAAAALAKWEAMKARSKAKKTSPGDLVDELLALDDGLTDGWTDAAWDEYEALAAIAEDFDDVEDGPADAVEGKGGYDPALDAKAAQPKFSDGVMVALYPPASAAASIARPGGLTAEELHVTLAYLGRITDELPTGGTLGDNADRIVAAVGHAAAQARALSGSAGGLGHFPAGDDGVPSWVPIDVPGLSGLRESVVGGLTGAGLPVSMTHGFAPHMTLGYDLDGVTAQDTTLLDFGDLAVVVGGDRYDLPLGAPAPVSAGGSGGTVDAGPAGGEGKAAAYAPGMDAPAVKGGMYDPSLDLAEEEAEDGLSGSIEDRQHRVRTAVREHYRAGRDREDVPARRPDVYASVLATFDDRVLVRCIIHHYDGESRRCVHEIPYTFDGGRVVLGEPVEVRAHVTFEGGRETTEDTPDALVTHNAADALENAAADVKALWLDAAEVKAGRVLSGQNVERVRVAAENLIAVLRGAGVDISRDDPKMRDEDVQPSESVVTDTSTTSASVRAQEKSAGGVVEVKAVDVEAALARWAI